MDRGEESGDEPDRDDAPLGGTVEAHGLMWKRVAGIQNGPRGDRPRTKMPMKKLVVNSHMKRPDFWKELFPVSPGEMLKAVKGGVTRHNDKGVGYTHDGLMAWLCCFYGGCQFAVGTDCWETMKKGMMPPPPISGDS